MRRCGQVLVAAALHSGGLRSSSVGHLTVHGTGTPLGDPIEVGALAGALSSGVSPVQIASVKVCSLIKIRI